MKQKKPIHSSTDAAKNGTSHFLRLGVSAVLVLGVVGLLLYRNPVQGAEPLDERFVPFVRGLEQSEQGALPGAFAVRKGKYYKAQTKIQQGIQSLSLSVINGTSETVLLQKPLPGQLIRHLQFLGDELIVGLETAPKQLPVRATPKAVATPRLLDQGEFAMPVNQDRSQEGKEGTVYEHKGLPKTTDPLVIYRVPLNKADKTFIPGEKLVAQSKAWIRSSVPMSEGVYWIDDPAGYQITATNQTQRYVEYPCQSRMVFTPRSGIPRVIAQNLWPLAKISAKQERLFWTQPRPFPDKRSDLFSVSTQNSADATPLECRNPPQKREPDAVLANRFYWIDHPYYRTDSLEGPLATGDNAVRLISTGPDGSDRREIAPIADKSGDFIVCRALFFCNGKLYLRYGVCEQEKATAEMVEQGYVPSALSTKSKREYLARVYPEFSDTRVIGKPVALPLSASMGRCEDHYFYFLASEESGRTSFGVVNAVADLFSPKAQVRSRQAAFRVALPE